MSAGTAVDVGDSEIHVVRRGEGFPLFVVHGGPGADHRMFGDYLDPLSNTYELIFVDQRGHVRSGPSDPETWTLEQHARDIGLLAKALGLDAYATLGHSYGAFVVLQHAVDEPSGPSATIVSSGVPSTSFLTGFIAENLATFEPVALREQVAASWEREKDVRTQEDFESLMKDQGPFHFADPRDPRIAEYETRTAGALYSPDVLRRFSSAEYGGIEVMDRLGDVAHPVMVLAGRHDRVCSIEAAQAMASGLPESDLFVFEEAGHMTFVEENERYLQVVRTFLSRALNP
jgi:proline iminopeptidase